MRKIAISDIHGCARTFRYLVEEQVALRQADHLFLLGDYIDRGPDSKGVIDYIFELAEKGYQLTCLLGNHEEMLLLSFTDYLMKDIWDRNGGKDTLRSFHVREAGQIPGRYMDFLKGLEIYHEVEDYIFVHAGMNFTEQDPLTDREAMLWSRKWTPSINYDWLGDRKIIHGHTPHDKPDILRQLKKMKQKQHLCIDGGCVFDHIPGFGQLCAVDLTNKKLYFAANRD
jgi:serine/threonine protein phosphatase 1